MDTGFSSVVLCPPFFDTGRLEALGYTPPDGDRGELGNDAGRVRVALRPFYILTTLSMEK
jgi:hypothetical protein